MRILLTASGRTARTLENASAAVRVASGQFEILCDAGTTLQALLEHLELDSQALLVIVDDTSIAPEARVGLALDESMDIALVPPIRAG